MTDQAAPPPSVAARVSDYARGSVANMIRSLLVIGAMMAVLFFAVARVNGAARPDVDVTTMARTVATSTGWPIVVPKDLPAGWTPSNVRFLTSTDNLRTWHVGYQTPAGEYVAVEQTKGATQAWVAAQTNRAPMTGSVQAAGRIWERFDRPIKIQRSLLHRATGPNDLSTLITGTGTFADLVLFAEHLQPFTP